MKYIITTLLLLCNLGCTSSHFDCPASKGVHCQKLSTVDALVDSGVDLDKPKKKKRCRWFTPKKIKPQPAVIHTTSDNPPVRVAEELLQVWLAPYETGNGVYHQASYLNLVVKPAYWEER